MTPQMALDLMYRALIVAMKMAAPVLITAIVVGVTINIVQTVTSIKDMSLTFVPKAVIAMIVIAFTLPWGLGVMQAYFEEMYMMFGAVVP